MIIVMITGGKRTDHYKTGVKVFDNLKEAKQWTEKFNNEWSDNKYWHYAEVIQPEVLYEVDTEDCWDGEFKYHNHGEVR